MTGAGATTATVGTGTGTPKPNPTRTPAWADKEATPIRGAVGGILFFINLCVLSFSFFSAAASWPSAFIYLYGVRREILQMRPWKSWTLRIMEACPRTGHFSKFGNVKVVKNGGGIIFPLSLS